MAFFIVKTDQDNPRHHGFHTNTSPYVLTTDPQPGDQITYVLPSSVRRISDESGSTLVGGSAEISCFSSTKENPHDSVRLRVLSHLGRSVLLGENGAEDAFGQDMLIALFLEVLNGCDWEYCPVDVEIVPIPDKGEPLSAEADRHSLWFRGHTYFKFQKDRWTVEEENPDEILLENRTEKLRTYLLEAFRSNVKALNDEDFEVLRQAVLVETDENGVEWINRKFAKEGRAWAENPVACTLKSLTFSEADYKFSGVQATTFVEKQISKRLAK